MAQNPVGGFLKALRVSRTQQRVQQDVVRFERGIGLEFSAPVAFFVLLREKIFLGRRDGRADPAAQFLDFSEAKLGFGTDRCWIRIGGVYVHACSCNNSSR